jgi:hypothetical protein
MRPLPVLAALLLLSACGDPAPRTQVMLQIDAEPEVRDSAVALLVRILAGDAGQPPDTFGQRFLACPLDTAEGLLWPRRIGLVPASEDPTRRYLVEATVFDAPVDCTFLATREEVEALRAGEEAMTTVRALSGYEAERTLVLPLTVEVACVGHPEGRNCPAPLTCQDGACVDAFIDPLDLQELEP